MNDHQDYEGGDTSGSLKVEHTKTYGKFVYQEKIGRLISESTNADSVFKFSLHIVGLHSII